MSSRASHARIAHFQIERDTMQRAMLYSKCHRATVTAADLNYEGSLSLDPVLMQACGWAPHEHIHVVNINNGQRFETYLIEAETAGTGTLQINGAAARLCQVSDLVIILSYCWLPEAQIQTWKPRVVCVNAKNQVLYPETTQTEA